jgi:thiol-disulfide isomerase/thioredoxin
MEMACLMTWKTSLGPTRKIQIATPMDLMTEKFGAGSNPTKIDSDLDGLNDAQEVELGTNPQVADSDGDGFTDGEEFEQQTDPLNRFLWDFSNNQFPDLSSHSDTVFGTGFEFNDIVVNFEAVDQNGDPIELFDFYSYVILFDFSAGWCNPCREAASTAQALWEKHREKGFMVIHVLTEGNIPGEPAFQVLQEQWASQYGITFPVLRQDENATYRRFTTSDVYPGSLPFILVLDREMRIDSMYGAGQEAAIEARVEQLLEVEVSAPEQAKATLIQAQLCDQDNDGEDNFSCGGQDCDDTDPLAHPLAAELCDNTDWNCDGRKHLDATDAPQEWLDLDEDTFGDAEESAMNCVARWPYVDNADDCNDNDPDLNPNTLWFQDADSDGYGNPDVSMESCTKPEGFVSNSQDSDDNNSSSLGCWTKIGVGRDHACALKGNGTLKCWGGTENPYDLITVPEGSYVDFSAGYEFTCALDASGTATCWGDQALAGTGDCLNPPPGPFSTISCGVEFCCGLTGTSGDNLTCWGRDDFGQSTPPPGTFTSVSAHGWWHACGVKDGGSIECWGKAEGHLGGPSPTEVPNGSFKVVSTGHYLSCAIDQTDHAQCWGSDSHNQSSPPTDQVYSDVSGGTVHSCGLRISGEIDCWGSNSLKRLDSPPGIFVQMEASQLHSCALNSDGLIECWGTDQGQGQLTPPSCTE